MKKRSEFAARTFAVMLCAWAAEGKADAVTDWDVRSGAIVAESGLGTPPAIRVLALAVARYLALPQANVGPAVTRQGR